MESKKLDKNNFRQLSREEFWVDESGVQIPYNRTTKMERLLERQLYSLFGKSLSASETLYALKADIEKAIQEIIEVAREENAVKLKGKGNYTFFNFDRSLKIEVSVNELIRFDDVKLESAKEVLLDLVRSSVTGDEFILSLVEDAFQTSRGKLDTRKILGLKKHTKRIKTASIRQEWEKAMSLIDESISRPDSKTYYRIWYRAENGQYQAIELNFSAL